MKSQNGYVVDVLLVVGDWNDLGFEFFLLPLSLGLEHSCIAVALMGRGNHSDTFVIS